MSEFIRPELRLALVRWREVLGAFLVIALGVWVFGFGGFFFQGVGALIALAGLAGVVIALRRLRFRRAVAQPGVVEVDEGQVRYFGPHGGGFASLPDLVGLEMMVDRSEQRWWQLREAGGNTLAIPVSAQGADQLFDAFASLQGLAAADLLRALDEPSTGVITVWRRDRHGVLT